MAKTPAIYLRDILDAIRRIDSYAQDMTRAQFVLGKERGVKCTVTEITEIHTKI